MKTSLVAATALVLSMTSHSLAQQEIRVGTSGTANTVLAIWMADAAGVYAKHGLKLTLSNMGGGSKGAAAVREGKLDVMHVGLSSVVQLNRKGAELRTIASLANMIRFAFFTAPSVKDAAELKGAVVAISSRGSESDAVATIALERLKLARSDVEIREFGDSPKRLAALRAGEVKATMLNEPYATQARADGLKPIVDLAAERVPWLFSTLVVSRSYLKENRDVLARFLRATAEGN
jgi:NitT/TauT family transport system substrate-binding protein